MMNDLSNLAKFRLVHSAPRLKCATDQSIESVYVKPPATHAHSCNNLLGVSSA